jgi:transposase
MRRHELTDRQWEQLASLRPPERPATGQPSRDHRTLLDGILWRLCAGAPWREVPERYGSWATLYSRFRRWRLAGVWDRVFAAVQARADAAGQLDWTVYCVDGTVIRARLHAAAATGDLTAEALGHSRGGFSTKVRLRRPVLSDHAFALLAPSPTTGCYGGQQPLGEPSTRFAVGAKTTLARTQGLGYPSPTPARSWHCERGRNRCRLHGVPFSAVLLGCQEVIRG